MNRSKLHLLWNVAAALLLSVGFASCSQDNMPQTGGTPLPDGKYPLSLTATVGTPQTRAGGKDEWQGGEEIAVSIGDYTGKYTMDANGKATAAGTPYYWQNTDKATVIAWFPCDAQTNVDISDQSQGYAAFDFLYAETEGSYAAPVKLTFDHRMAKISVTLEAGTGFATDADLSTAEVTVCPGGDGIKAYNDKPNKQHIALIAPAKLAEKEFSVMIALGGTTYVYTSPTPCDFKANTQYAFALTLNKTGVTLSGCTITGWTEGSKGGGNVTWYDKIFNLSNGETVNITGDGNYLITGTGTNTVTISGGSPTITLKDVNVTAYPAVEVTGGNPTFILEGNNTLTTKQGKGALYNVPGTTITIDGNGTLTAVGAWNTAGIGGGSQNSQTVFNCGKIIIKGGTVNASGSGGAAAIGCGYWVNCEGIEILGGTVSATTGNGYQDATIATIGTGLSSSCAYVKLADCTIKSNPNSGHSVVRATTVTPAYDDVSALKAAGVTIYINDVLYTK